MREKKMSIIFVLFLCSITIYSQNTKSEFNQVKKNAISLNLLGAAPIIGFTYERVLSKKISAEVGVGFLGLGATIKVFPFNIRPNRLMFHTGFGLSYNGIPNEDDTLGNTVMYIPVGFSFFGNIFNAGIDIGPALDLSDGGSNRFIGYGNLKLGIRF